MENREFDNDNKNLLRKCDICNRELGDYNYTVTSINSVQDRGDFCNNIENGSNHIEDTNPQVYHILHNYICCNVCKTKLEELNSSLKKINKCSKESDRETIELTMAKAVRYFDAYTTIDKEIDDFYSAKYEHLREPLATISRMTKDVSKEIPMKIWLKLDVFAESAKQENIFNVPMPRFIRKDEGSIENEYPDYYGKQVFYSEYDKVESVIAVAKKNEDKRLEISYSYISQLPSSIGKLVKLNELIIRKSGLKDLPDSIVDLKGLRLLDLSGSVLERLPDKIGKLSHLEILDIRNTWLQYLPDSIGDLKLLKTLYCSGTLIQGIPDTVGCMSELTYADFSGNKIECLPESIGLLPKIEVLDISMNLLASLPNNLCSLDSLNYLNLSWNQRLRSLPHELGLLKMLRRLDLSYTHIEYLSDSFTDLTELRVIDLHGCKSFTKLPERIGNLKNLEEIYIDETSLSNIPDSITEIVGLRIISISGMPITSLPDKIGELHSLNEIDMSHTRIKSLPESFVYLSELTTVDLSGCNHLKELPKEIGRLNNLKELYLDDTAIISIPDSITAISNLQIISLSGTPITSLPEKIENLHSLRELNIAYSKLRVLPTSLNGLRSIRKLNLRNTLITQLPDSVYMLSSLTHLLMGRSRLEYVDQKISQLSNLRILDLSSTNIKELPDSLCELKNLQSLYLENTMIRMLPNQIGNMKNLMTLSIDKSKEIRELPISIEKLKKLYELNVSNTSIECIPASILKLKNLERIGLINLKIKAFPKEIAEFRSGIDYRHNRFTHLSKGIYIKGLSLSQQPISLFYQSYEVIRDYFKRKKTKLYETKVIFLGSEGVGKTHTIKRILNNNHKIMNDLPETPGIIVSSKIFEPSDIINDSYRINFWDFGGQEIMHSMHRCFLTDRTGYVVVVSTRFGDVDKQARYWLRNIDSFTNGVPVVIFVNCWSGGTEYGIDENSLRKEYPNIIAIEKCSAKDDEDEQFSKVVESIKKMAISNDSIGMLFPESWECVRQEISALGKIDPKKYYISQQDFQAKCEENNIHDEGIQQWLLDWFNDLGNCFSYWHIGSHKDATKDLKILDPEWLTNAIYIIIREAGDLATNGFVSHKGIRNKLDHSKKGTLINVKYSEAECDYVLEVMRKFRLSFKVPGQNIEFIPALLSDNSPSDLDYTGNAIFYEMRYINLPENVMHNLMIAMYLYLDHQRCWRKGAVIDVRSVLNIGLLAVLDMSREDEILRIKVYSSGNHAPWELLQEIRTRLLEINNRMNLKAEDFIILPSDKYIEEVSVDRLLDIKARGSRVYQGRKIDYEIDDIIGNTFGIEQVRKIENINYQKDDRNILGENATDEHLLNTMREALIPKSEELLLSSMKSVQATCDKLCTDLLLACAEIQSNILYWNANENVRSTQVRDILRNRGWIVIDQTIYGQAQGSMNPGRLDLMVMRSQTEPLTIIEAMNIDCVSTGYIFDHLKKLVDDYNPSGFKELFLVAYVKKRKKNFQSFWKSYRDYIEGTHAGDFHYHDLSEIDTGIHFLKHAVVHYDCGGALFTVHHICMRVAD